MIGIYDCFGYDVSFRERYKLIKNAGFDSVMLWWSDKFGRGGGYQEDVQYARDEGLFIENIHTPVHEQNYISLDNQDGKSVFVNYLQCVTDCHGYAIPTMVVHLPNDKYPLNELGMQRLKTIVEQAEEYDVNIALENLDNIQNLALVMDTIQSKNTGYCYDSCHHINYSPDCDLLERYGERLMAIHLQDNGGKRNQHQLPFDGSIDWKKVMKKVSLTGYKGATSLEPMNWDYKNISIQEFLSRAYQKAKKLYEMRSV
ncbi:sugar phosphate isomerase/epimerase family protein [Lacrimispora sp.]|uniref:sugar phosphate isomerase/epimerase family protein n=1 Tax=Lacrimispora sp. TaxID=2719234 RepID=UPI0028B21158|nr:sugar phosphate isomerase/epimerase family protein [Lacrimispora sp.]